MQNVSAGPGRPAEPATAGASWFDRWFMVPISPVRLGAFRIAVALIGLQWAVWPNKAINAVPRGLDRMPAEFIEPLWITRPLFWGNHPPSDHLLDVLQVIVAVAFLLLLVGLFTRFATILCATVGFMYFGVGNSYRTIFTLNGALYLAVLIGLFSDWGAALSVDARRKGGAVPEPSARYGLFIRLANFLVGYLYLLSVIQKVTRAPEWWAGHYLWSTLIEMNYFVRSVTGDPTSSVQVLWLARQMIEHPWLAMVGQWATLVYESTFILTFFFPRLVPFYLMTAAGFHMVIYFTIPPVPGVSFFPYYLALIPIERLLARGAPRVPAPPVTAGFATGARVLVATFFTLELAVAAARERWQGAAQRLLWPFSQMSMFTDRRTGITFQWVLADGEHETVLKWGEIFHPQLAIGQSPPWERLTLGEWNERFDRGLAWTVRRYRCEHHLSGDRARIYRLVWRHEDLLHAEHLAPAERTLIREIPLPPGC